jgi:Zn-dependent peptidase ImmA (M78 family)
MQSILKPTEELRTLEGISPSPEQVLKALGLETKLPIDPEVVATKLGINCRTWSSAELSRAFGGSTIRGLSHWDSIEDTFWVVYGAEWHRHAKRFIIAQELGHILLHKEHLPIYRDPDRTSRAILNRQAAGFAAELLMPELLVRKYSKCPLEVIAKEFDVSTKAAEIRLSFLGLRNRRLSGVNE